RRDDCCAGRARDRCTCGCRSGRVRDSGKNGASGLKTGISFRTGRTGVALALVLLSACVSNPPPKLPAAPAVAEGQKIAWILQPEDPRLLPLERPAPAPPPAPVKGRKQAAPAPPPSSSPDLAVLVRDNEARVRRRAALAIGRVKEKAGVPLLTPLLTDTD